jgi:hypothetical protein
MEEPIIECSKPMEFLRCALLRWAVPLVFGLAAVPAQSVTLTDLYETAQPVQESRDAAFVEALKTILVRVSGQRDAAVRIGAEVNEPRKYVRRFGFRADGVLEVAFDSASVDELLSQAGLPIWGRERPSTLVMVSFVDARGSERWLSADLPSAEREALLRVAKQRGLPLTWATMDSQDRAQANAGTAAQLQVAARYGANAALVGQSRAGQIRWTLVSGDGAAEASGDLDEGVHLAADTFARVFAASSSSLGSVVLEVTGINDLNAYAATLNYLEAMTLVRGVALEQVSGESMRFRLAVRGDAATLRRAIALDNRLVPTDSSSEPALNDRLAFRYQP